MKLWLILHDILVSIHLGLLGLNLREVSAYNELTASCKDNFARCVLQQIDGLNVLKQIEGLVRYLPLEDGFENNLPYLCYLKKGTVPYMEWCIPCSDVDHGCARDGLDQFENWVKVCRLYCPNLYTTADPKSSASHQIDTTVSIADIETSTNIESHKPDMMKSLNHFSKADIIVAIFYVCLALLSYLAIIIHYICHRELYH